MELPSLHPQDHDAAADAATLNSDAAVVADGMGGAASDGDHAPPPAGAAAVRPEGRHPRHRSRRKRALSAAGPLDYAGLHDGNPPLDYAALNGHQGVRGPPPHLSSASLMNSSVGIGSQFMSSGVGAEHSIVSFGLNFNFDGASSPSNSDSGGKGGLDGSSGEDDNNNGNDLGNDLGNLGGGGGMMLGSEHGRRTRTVKVKPVIKHRNNFKSPGATATASTPGGEDKKKKGNGSRAVKFGPNCTTGANAVAASANAAAAAKAATPSGEEGSSTSSGSDSGNNESSGGSAFGGSNNSGGKSTISSLTTSSNQEWMATNESVAEKARQDQERGIQGTGEGREGREGQVGGEGGGGVGEKDGTDMKAPAPRNNKNPLTGKKRKANVAVAGVPQDSAPLDARAVAGMGTAMGGTPDGAPAVDGPPMKQARFSLAPHQENAPQGGSAYGQMLSSLSGSDSNGGRSPAGAPAGRAPAAPTGPPPGSAFPLALAGAPPGSAFPLALAGAPPGSAFPLQALQAAGGLAPAGPAPPAVFGMSDAAPEEDGGAAKGRGGAGPDRRKERNAREKERSCRIAKQIDDLRTLLSRGGVIVSKGTKSSVLSEAATYINLLQQQQVQWEMDRQNLMQQMQQIQAQNDMSLNGGMSNGMDAQSSQQLQQGQMMGAPGQQQHAVSPNDYKFVFNNSSVGMAIASLGGAFVDCNSIFCQLSNYTREEICAMTVFNITSRQDLQHAFDLISQMITPTLDGGNAPSKLGDDKSSIILRGAMKSQQDLGLSISLIKGEQGVAKCFCVTLVRILSIETTRPDTVSIEVELPQVWPTKQQKNVGFGASPAYTAG